MTATASIAAVGRGIKTFAQDVAEGFFEITHNGLALLGIVVVIAVALLGTRPDLRAEGEHRLTEWLTARKVAAMGITPELGAIERATAANPRDLPREQANVALWISKKYRVAPEPVAALVAEAYDVGRSNKLDPTLILAVMAIESSFNPFAQSPVGAQGLMQVMTQIHSDKYEHFGGQYAAFDPKSNLRVGVKVLSEYVSRTGSVEGGLKWYVGAANMPSDGGYADKVLAEHARLAQVAKGKPIPVTDNSPALRAATEPTPSPAPATTAAPVKVAALSCSLPQRAGPPGWRLRHPSMSIAFNVAVALIGLLHVYILVLEMFLWNTPRGRKAFGLTPEFAQATKTLAANQGLYNGFLAAGLFWGLSLGVAGDAIKVFFLLCVLVAGLYGAATASRRILLVQALPAAIGLGLYALSR